MRRRALAGLVLLVLAALASWVILWRDASVPPDAPLVVVSQDTSILARAGITTVTYDVALVRAGARARTVRPDEPVARALDGARALLLAGGGDVDPALYGQEGSPAQLVDRARDDFELALVAEALRRGLPILGICRGVQLLNVAHGGSLRTLRGDAPHDALHGIDLDSLSAHGVDVKAGSRLAQVVGAGHRRVSSFHGQAVDRVGDGLAVVAVAEDGIAEAVERTDRPFVVGVQWHPEIQSVAEGEELALFRALVKAAAVPPARDE